MTGTEITKRLPFPLPLPDSPSFLVVAHVPAPFMIKDLGPAMHTDWGDGLGQADLWGYEYPCGLQVVIEYFHGSRGGLILADSPEIEHVLRHIPVPRDFCIRVDQESLESAVKSLLKAFPDRQQEIDALHSFQVWRQGTDGNPFKVGSSTSKRDAECWVNHLDSLGHHQHYWCSRVGAS